MEFHTMACKDNYDDVKEYMQTDKTNINECMKTICHLIFSAYKSKNMVDRIRIIGLIIDEYPMILFTKNSHNHTPIELINNMMERNNCINYILIKNKLNQLVDKYNTNCPREA